jgi:prolyl-tRNA editing enzyme YbaK/EbsC (Cys-tRNA(Pro) deacylase)
VLSAALRIDSRKVKEHFKAKNTRFATTVELRELTGLVPGSVPPFGAPILNLDLYVDNSVLLNERVAFNAGSLTDSIIMRSRDYADLSHGEIFDFSHKHNATEGDKGT